MQWDTAAVVPLAACTRDNPAAEAGSHALMPRVSACSQGGRWAVTQGLLLLVLWCCLSLALWCWREPVAVLAHRWLLCVCFAALARHMDPECGRERAGPQCLALGAGPSTGPQQCLNFLPLWGVGARRRQTAFSSVGACVQSSPPHVSQNVRQTGHACGMQLSKIRAEAILSLGCISLQAS